MFVSDTTQLIRDNNQFQTQKIKLEQCNVTKQLTNRATEKEAGLQKSKQ